MKNKNDSFILTGLIDDSTDLIPLLSTSDEEQMNSEEVPDELSILPLRNMVLFPGVVIPITIGRDKSIKLIKDANKTDKVIGVISQINKDEEDPDIEDLYKTGTVANILKMLQMPDGSTTVIIQGKRRFNLLKLVQKEPYFKCKIKGIVEPKISNDNKFKALVASLKDLALNIIRQSPNIPSEAAIAVKNIESPSFLINFISSNINVSVGDKQKMLETSDLKKRANLALGFLTRELQMLEMKNEIQSKVKTDLDKQQREYFLNQQMKTIQEELGVNPVDREIEDLKARAKNKQWNKTVEETFTKELEKLKRVNPASPEYSVQINYVDILLELPWNEYTKDNFDLKRAYRILDRDHYGLQKVKERIIEHLAVLKLKGDMKSPILCLVGPPGVGKTSLGKSIAEALDRKYVRMSLGGLKDEAEIRGHRKTYIGAMPGRIMQNLKKAKSANPVFVLDEVDKVGNDYHGDPSSALLEVLDPEQNSTFYDNFIELDFDLSRVLFIATANNLSTVHPALLDRMEIIEVNGYTQEEKVEIAKRHLLRRQFSEHGMDAKEISIPKATLVKIISEHTYEAGVRTLEKHIAKIIRQVAKKLVMGEEYNKVIKKEDVQKYLGPGHSRDKYQGNNVAGVVTGLAWTSVGGDILFIESNLTKGKGKLTLTGNLGDVMKESAMIALEYLKAHADLVDIEPDVFGKWNVHIHVPEGATPKDGPSAGIAMFTALTSIFTQRKVKPRLAMTGEITLRGRVLAIGGVKEKVLAARRANIREIVISEDNKKDIEEIDSTYLKSLKFHYVTNMLDVIKIALLNKKVQRPLKVI